MKNWMKALVCVALSFGFLFTALGYAAVTDNLNIAGKAKIDIPAGVYIIAMEEASSNRLDVKNFSYYSYSTTVDTSLSKSERRYEGTVTYKITVLNNTEYEYAYRDIYYQDDLEANNSIGSGITVACSLDSASAANKKIAPGATKELTVTYKLSSSTSIDRNKTYRNIVNIRFGINVDSLEQAHNVLMEKFAEILNSASSYAELYDKINDKFDGNQEWTSNFIGNVDGSSSADSVTMNSLFGGQLQMVIGDQPQTVTALIKHEDVDGDETTGDSYTITYNNGSQQTRNGCEYTIYLTTEKLDSWSFDTYPTVYAATFTRSQNADGTYTDWYQKGDIYQGTARVVGYMGEESGGSFDTGTWRSAAATYSPSPNYSYSLNSGMTIQQVMQSIDGNAAQALAELLTRAKEILDSDKYAGTGVIVLQAAYDAAKPYFDIEADGTIVVHDHVPVSVLIEHIDELAVALKAFEGVP